MKMPWSATEKPKDLDRWKSAAYAHRPEARDDWVSVLGRDPRPGEIIDDMVLEALVRLQNALSGVSETHRTTEGK